MVKNLYGFNRVVLACSFFAIIDHLSAKLTPINEMPSSNATVVYRVVATVHPPFVMKDENSARGFKGFGIDLLNEIARVLSFEYDIYEVEDKLYGISNDKGEWNGMVRELMDKNADIGIPLMSITSERDNVIDFTVPFTDDTGQSILMKREIKSRALFKFIEVLEWKVWLCIVVAFLSASALMWIMDRWSPQRTLTKRNTRRNVKVPNNPMKMTDCLWFSLLSLTPQGGGQTPRAISGKLVAAVWYLFGFIVITSYTANLAAFLTVKHLEKPIESLDDLSNQFKIKYSTLNGSMTMVYFRRMFEIETGFHQAWRDMYQNSKLFEKTKLSVWEFPVTDKYATMWRTISETGMPNTMQEALERVRKSTPDGGFAFLGDGIDLQYLELTSCDLKTIGKDFARKPTAIAIQEGSPLKEPLDNTIFQLMHSGYMDELKAKWWNRNIRNTECKVHDNVPHEISIRKIGGLFILLMIGICGSIVTLIFEYLWFKHYKAPKAVVFGANCATRPTLVRANGMLNKNL